MFQGRHAQVRLQKYTRMVRAALLLALMTLASACVLESEPVGRRTGSPDGGAGGSAGAVGSGGSGGSAGTGGTSGSSGVGGGGGCTPESEDEDCPGTTCNPVTLECSEFYPGDRGICETCVSDRNCWGSNQRCVGMLYQDLPFPDAQTGFCLPVAEREFVGGPYRCDGHNPYVAVLYDHRSISGGEVEAYCGVREDFTTCVAVLVQQQEERCPAGRDDECPTGGLCRYLNVRNDEWEYRCTYACSSSDECVDKTGKPLDCGGYCGS